MSPILLLALLSCHGDGPKIDENGCWEDGEEAYLAMIELSCRSGNFCNGQEIPQSEIDRCLEESMFYLDYYRESLCFDGCAVDTCLARLREYNETCDVYVETGYCDEETFYDGLRKECVQRPW